MLSNEGKNPDHDLTVNKLTQPRQIPHATKIEQ